MPRLRPDDIPLTPEEDAAVAGLHRLSDPDTFELDAEWFAGARPAIRRFFPFSFKNYGRYSRQR